MVFLNAHTHISRNPENEILQLSGGQSCVSFHSVGIHPWDSNDYTLPSLPLPTSCIAIGEIGLDKRTGPPLSIQLPVFEDQVRFAETQQLPVILHCVKAWNELRQVKRKMNPVQPWVYHGFLQAAIVEEVVNEGLVISLGAGILTHPKAAQIVSHIPDHQLLLETDDAQVDIGQVYVRVAELKKISLHELEELITRNFQHTFKRWHTGLNAPN